MKYLISFLLIFLYIPQIFSAHYDFSLPIFLHPASNNPYLNNNTNKTIISKGEHIAFDDYYQNIKNPNSPIIYPNIFVKNFFCTPPLKDGIPLFDNLSIYHPFTIEANPHLSSKRKFASGKINNQNIPIFYGWQIFGNFIPEKFSYREIMCSATPDNFLYNLTKNDTASLRIQYPIHTDIVIKNTQTQIHSNYTSAYTDTKEKMIVLWNGSINHFAWIDVIQKVTAEKLNGEKVDITKNFTIENMTENEEYLIPIDTAVLHFEFK